MSLSSWDVYLCYERNPGPGVKPTSFTVRHPVMNVPSLWVGVDWNIDDHDKAVEIGQAAFDKALEEASLPPRLTPAMIEAWNRWDTAKEALETGSAPYQVVEHFERKFKDSVSALIREWKAAQS